MSAYTLIVSPEIILALKEFIPAKETRNYLLGLHVEINQDDSFLVATDGHVMGVYRHPDGHNDPEQGRKQFTVPKELLVGLKPRGSVALSFDEEEKTCTLSQRATSRSANLIEDRYPNWRQVIPSEITGEAAQYDPALLTLVHKAAKPLGLSPCYVTLNGLSAGHVNFGREHLFGVIMPLHPLMASSFPEWCRE